MGMAPHGPWQQLGWETRKNIRLPQMAFPVQGQDVENARWYVSNCWPEMPADCVPGIFSFSQTGEILTVWAPRKGKEWMRLNPRHDAQRWAALNSQLAVLAGSRVAHNKTMLEQLESLVQPTQFLEYLRKTMPMTDSQLDMVTSMHETMVRQLNALDVFFRGGQKAVNEFKSNIMTGIEKLKSAAISKAKRSNNTSGGKNCKRSRRGGGGGGGGGGVPNPASGGLSSGGGFQSGSGQYNNRPRPAAIKCDKCNRIGHRTQYCKGL
jgi:uncharacterized membrane protein YgcG